MISKFHGLAKALRVAGQRQSYITRQTKFYFSNIKNTPNVGGHPGMMRERQFNDDVAHQIARENVPGKANKKTEVKPEVNASQLNDQPAKFNEKHSSTNKSEHKPNAEEIQKLRQKFADELKSISESDGKKQLSAQTIREIMESAAELSPEEFSSMYSHFSEKLPKRGKNLSAQELTDQLKSFIGNKENWKSGKTSDILTDKGIMPAVWEKEMDYYIKEDNTFGAWYTNLQQSLIQKSFPLEDFDEKKKGEIRNLALKHYEQYSKEDQKKGVSHDKFIEELQNKYGFGETTQAKPEQKAKKI